MAKSDNMERYGRILDAAAGLFIQYGFDKTAVSDIAREAGVSHGAVYLHFESKDALFKALYAREMERFAQIWLERVEADPQGGTLAGMYKNMLHALHGSPFMAALFRRDRRVLGNYLRKPGNIFQQQQSRGELSPRYAFVRRMQEAGALRQELDPSIIAHIMNMLAYGLVAMDEIMAEEDIPPVEEIIEGIAYLMDRALTPEGGGDSPMGKAILREIFESVRQQDQQAQPTGEEQQEIP